MDNKKTLINIISSVLLQAITVICGFIVPKLIISSFGSNVNGLIVSITQFLAYITLIESGFGPVVKSILYEPIANKDKAVIEDILKTSENFFKKIAYIFLAYMFILCTIFQLIVPNEFEAIFTISLIIIIAISTFSEYYFGMTYRLYLQAEQKTYVISAIHMSTLFLNTIIVIALIHFGASIHIVKLAGSIIYILRPISLNIYVKKKYNIDLKKAKGNYKIKQKWDGLAQHLAFVVHKNTDIVILTLCRNLVEVSVYSVYLMIINRLKSIVQSFTGGIDAAFGDMIAKEDYENLNKSFKNYEGFYCTIATIVFSSTLFLIVPFVKLYTKGITDANYIRPAFAYILVIAEFIWAIRQPYNDLVKCAGHFKQTKIGAWIEAISNIVISFVLVWNFGIVGVAIGTLFAMAIRTIEFMHHTSKYILKRSIWYSFKRLIIITVEIILVSIIVNLIPHTQINGYGDWIIRAIAVSTVSGTVVISTNCTIYTEKVKSIIKGINGK